MLLLSNYKDNNFRDTYTYFIVSTADFLMLIKQSLPPASVSGRSKGPEAPSIPSSLSWDKERKILGTKRQNDFQRLVYMPFNHYLCNR